MARIAIHIVRNVLVLAAFWLISFGLMQIAQRLFTAWQAAEIAQILGCGAGVFLAMRLRAPVAALLLAGQAAFSLSEFAMHSTYSIRAVQGAPTHFAVMIAATLGVVFGALLVARMAPSRLTAS